MRLYFNLDTNQTIRFRDMDANGDTANTWSSTTQGELVQDLIDSGLPLDEGYTFSSDLDFPEDYGYKGDPHSHVEDALEMACRRSL